MKKIGSVIVSFVSWFATLAVLLLCILLGRLFFSPIDVGFAREQVITRTAELLPGWDISFSEASIGWDWTSVRPWLILEDIQLVDRRDRLTASLSHVEIGLGFRGTLAGIGVSTIAIDRSTVHVTDVGGFSDATDDSLFADLFGANGIPKPEVFLPLTEAFNRFSLRLLNIVPEFERVEFDGLVLRVSRGDTLSDATINLSNLSLTHTENDLALATQMDISIGGNPVSTRLRGRAQPDSGDLSIVLGLSDFYPSSFPADAGLPAFLKYVQLPLELTLALDLDAKVGLQSAEIDAVLGEGQLSDPVVFPDAAAVQYGVIDARYDVAERTLVINDIDLSTGTIQVQGNGLVYWQEGSANPGLQVDLRIPDAAINDIMKYWPRSFHEDGRERGARAWVAQNMIQGTTENVRFAADVTPDGIGTFLNDSPYQLTFDFKELDTRFVSTMPPLLLAAGSAELTEQQMTINLTDGYLLGMPIASSTASLSNIHIPYGGVGNFEIYTRGKVKTLMELIDHPPLRVAKKAKLDIERLDGDATVKAFVTLPLLRDPGPGSTKYNVSAHLTDVSVSELLGGEGLSAAQLSITVDQDSLAAAGQGLLNGVAVNLRWDEDFAIGRDDPAADTTLIVMDGHLDADDIAALGVDVGDYLFGKTRTEASFTGRNFKFSKGTFSADASTAELRLNPLAWAKPVGAPANITGTIVFDETGTRIAPFSVEGEGLSVTADLIFGSAGQKSFTANIKAPQIGRNNLQARITQRDGAPLDIAVDAETFDIAPYLAAANALPQSDNSNLKAKKNEADLGFDLTLNARTLLFENGENWNDATLALAFRGGEPVSLALDAQGKSEGAPISIVLDANPDPVTGARAINLAAANGGEILRSLGLFSHVDGGRMTLVGSTSNWGDSWNFSGAIEIRDAQLFPSTDLGENVTKGIVTGLDDYITDGSLPLDVLDVPFQFKDNLLTINGLKANGPSLGLTLEGEIATADGIMNVNGVVVPAYGLNSLLGNLPLVGGLFTGGEGKGLFGVAYRVKGSIAKPDVTVNAMSGLAPGFLRLLFEGRKGRVSDVELPDVEPEAAILEGKNDDPPGIYK